MPGRPARFPARRAARDVAEQARARSAVERAAVDAVLAIERALGRDPVEMPPNNKGYDIESKAADGIACCSSR